MHFCWNYFFNVYLIMPEKTIRNAVKDIRKGLKTSLYILNGNDYYLQSIIIDELINYYTKSGVVEKKFFSSDSQNFTSIILDLKMDSLFNTNKLFVINNPSRLIGKEKENLINYCKNPNLNHTLILSFDKVENKFLSLNNYFTLINTSTPFPNRITAWLDYILNKKKINADFETKNLLIDLYGDSLYHLSEQIEKIKINIDETDKISKESILKFSGWKRDYFPWQLLDSVGKRDFNKSIKICNSLFDQGIDASYILNQLVSLFIEIYFSFSKTNNDFKIGWLNKIILNNITIYSKNYNKSKISFIIKDLLKVDKTIKSFSVDKKNLIKILLFKIQFYYE